MIAPLKGSDGECLVGSGSREAMSSAESIAGPQHRGNTPKPRLRTPAGASRGLRRAVRYSGDERLHKGTVNGDARSFMRQIGWYRGVAVLVIPSLGEKYTPQGIFLWVLPGFCVEPERKTERRRAYADDNR